MFKKILTIIIEAVIIVVTIGSCDQKVMSRSLPVFKEGPVNVGVFLSSQDDVYATAILKALEQIEKENEGEVQYNFFDGKKDQSIQNEELDELLEKKEVDLIILNLVNKDEITYAIDRIKENNIPVIFFGGINIQTLRSYSKAYWIGTDAIEGGILQGEAIVNIWNNSKENIDKNKDNIMQYIMIKGPANDMYAIERSKYSISTTDRSAIRTQELAAVSANWSEEEAKNITKSLFLRYGNNIEMIIANNDAMAIGVIKALQEYGYNTGDERMTIPVVGFDGTKVAQDLIKKDIMAGTVIQDPYDYAKAFYTVGMNLVYNRDPLGGTEYKLDDTIVSIILPYKGIVTNIDEKES